MSEHDEEWEDAWEAWPGPEDFYPETIFRAGYLAATAHLSAEREGRREGLRGGEGMKDGVGELSLDQLIGWVETEYRKVRVMSDPRPLHLAAISEYLRRARKLVGGQ